MSVARNENPVPLVICLMGPTASGKTDLAIDLAQRRNCELISVDSVLVYRDMNIGSAKPDYPHHLVDIRDPAESYSAAEFVTDATALVQDIVARGKTPLLVGGTMLYFKALLQGLDNLPGTHAGIRADIAAQAAVQGWPSLHCELAQVDPQAAARIHPNHSQRLSRALEVYRSSGIPLSEWHSRGGGKGPLADYRVVQMAICPEQRSVLHQRIAQRFEVMMAAGFLEEVRGLWQRGDLHKDLPAVRAVGYRQLWEFLEGGCSAPEAVEKAVAATRQLAKRQLTWLRKWPDLEWIYTDCAGNLAQNARSHEVGQPLFEKPLDVALNYLGSAPQ